jgi:TonB-dependent receptor
LNGEHHFQFKNETDGYLDDIIMEWGFETSEATRLEPGTVEYTYEKTSDVTDYTLNKKIWYMYSDLIDEVENYRVDFKLPFKYNDRNNYTTFGLFVYNKSRSLDNRRFKVEHGLGTEVYDDIDSVFTETNADNDDLVVTSNYRDDDAYSATQDVTAFYIKQLLSLRNDIDINLGFRQEISKQQLIDSKSGDPYDPLETTDLLPSLGLTYRLNNEHQIRFGYANSLSRPDFREFSPNRYKDPITDDIVFGYPDLKYTEISNIDLKYEWYPSYDELISFAIFQKDFTNPIETITNIDTNSQAGNKIISYRNALGATSTGWELGLRKKLNFIDQDLSNYFIAFNYASIESEIDLDKNSDDTMIKELTSSVRPMQGQSPYVSNLQIGYDNINTGRSALLLYNEYGERIVSLGTYGAPDYYEKPYKKMDFVVKWQLNDSYDEQIKKVKWSLNFKAENLLDSKKTITQGSVISKEYSPGQSFSFSFSAKY